MSSVLPGKPQSRLQSLTVACWNNQHFNAYISGNAFTILDASQTVLQTVYNDDGQPLQAIAIDEATGKIATSTATNVLLYRPLGEQGALLKWILQLNISCDNMAPISALSWGCSEELLVAGKHLALFRTRDKVMCSWNERLPNQVKSAALSYDSAYITSISHYDRQVKVWRRLTYGSEDVRFDLSYLRHTMVVTAIRWRKPFHVELTAENVLYTVCLDGFVRIWTPTDTLQGFTWQLWGKVNLNPPLSDLSLVQKPWLTCIIDGRDFTASVERAVQERLADDHSTDDIAIDHLVAIANRNPEICLAINSSGMMSAWALENIPSEAVDNPQIFRITHHKSPYLDSVNGFLAPYDDSHVEMQIYCDRKSGQLCILLHVFDGKVGVFTSNVADLFDPTINDKRILLSAVWSGHSAPIEKIVRNFSGQAVLSRAVGGETIVWSHAAKKPTSPSGSLGLIQRSNIPNDGNIRRICVLRKGRFAVFLSHNVISLWDCRCAQATLISQSFYEVLGTPLCLMILPRPHGTNQMTAHIATVSSERYGIVWEINLPRYTEDAAISVDGSVREFCRFKLEQADDLKYVLPVDPAGPLPVISGFLDLFSRDIAVSYTNGGRIDFWAARVNMRNQSVDWLSTCNTETGLVSPSLASGSMLKKAALVSSSMSQLTIWDVGGSRLEFDKDYRAHNIIQDLDWTSTPDAQLILAVGFRYRVILLSQMRFDYLNKGAAWAPVREISILDFTPHPIGDSTWLDHGHLIIGAGNQLFVYDRSVSNTDSLTTTLMLPHHRDGTWDLFEAVQRFNGPLPVFHPQFLSQCILAGKSSLARQILIELQKRLNFLVPGESVDDYLGLSPVVFYNDTESRYQTHEKGEFALSDHSHQRNEGFTESIAASLTEKLTKLRIPQLSGHEQIQLVDMIECAAVVERQRRSMDENGARFMLFFRQHALRKGRTNYVQLSWREINWAYHSDSQDILVDFIGRHYHNKMQWEHACESGIFMWLTDLPSLRRQFEVIARNEYTRNEIKNPVACSLFYFALRKKNVVQGLWRLASGNVEQDAVQRLLANNFEEPRWRTAALKNAYALLSKRRFQYAAAFFILAGHLDDAVEVCLRQLKDMQLAITITRVYEGDDGPVLQKLLKDEVLTLAAQEGNRWLASWAFWMLGRKDMAVRALITPVYTLIETPYSADFKSRLFLTDDPALVVLYSQLRQQTLQTLRGASKVPPKIEWEFVLHSAKLYDRMGCDLLGLALVRNWEFQQHTTAGFGGEVNPLKLLRRRGSLVVDDLPLSDVHRTLASETRGASHPLAVSSTFQEPDITSLLDSFGL